MLSMLLLVTMLLIPSFTSKAAEEEYDWYLNEESGYWYTLSDEADLFTDEEEASLLDIIGMNAGTGYFALLTISENPYSSASDYGYAWYDDKFGSESGTVFLIDMDNRFLFLRSNGYNSTVITNSISDTITDNVYRYASDGDYYSCAYEALLQINSVLNGNAIAAPMKVICNVLLAIVVSLLINFFLIMITSRSSKASDSVRLDATISNIRIMNARAIHTRTERIYDPPSSSSSSSGGGGGGGSSSGGSSGGHGF